MKNSIPGHIAIRRVGCMLYQKKMGSLSSKGLSLSECQNSQLILLRCVGVFDTVGSVGLPDELNFGSKKIRNLFGFPDTFLGSHISRVYHALALNETRKDFVRLRIFDSTWLTDVLDAELYEIPSNRVGKEEGASSQTGACVIPVLCGAFNEYC